MSRYSGNAPSFPSHLFLGLNAFLFTVLYVTFQLIRTEWRCPNTVECNVFPSLPAILFVVLNLWSSFFSSLTIQLFRTWSGNHPPKFFLRQKIYTNLISHACMLLTWWRMFSYSTKQIRLNAYFGMGEQVVIYINETKFILVCQSFFCDWMLFNSLLKFWESQHFGNWARLCVSLGGSCCCWQLMLTLPYFLHKFVETGKLWWNSLLGIFTKIFVLLNSYWNGTAWMTALSDVLYFLLTRSPPQNGIL